MALRIVLCLLTLAFSSPAPGQGLPPEAHAAISRAGMLISQGRTGDGYGLLDSLTAVATAHADTSLLLAVDIARGGHLAWSGRAVAAEPPLRWALPLAAARGDSSLQVRASMWLAYAMVTQGRHAAAESLYLEHLPVADALGDAERGGFMRLGLAYTRLVAGDPRAALAGYQAAEGMLAAAGNSYGEIDAITGQGRAWEQLGELDQARASYERVAELSRQRQRPDNHADALNNLGSLEFVRGDPAAGLRAFRGARAIRSGLDNRYAMVTPACNEARALAELGRVTEAGALLDSLSVTCGEQGFSGLRGHILNLRADLHMRRGEPRAAMASCRAALAIGPDLAVWEQLQSHRGVARALAAMDSLDAALAVLKGPGLELRPLLSPDWALRLDRDLAERHLEAGHTQEAIALALRAADEALELRRIGDRVALLAIAASGEMALGDTTTARVRLEQAAREWEGGRTLSSDPEWRERRADVQLLGEKLVVALLADSGTTDRSGRIEAAFAAAQRFKARTLVERMRGLGSVPDSLSPTIGVAQLRDEVLAEGECLLDLHVGRERSHAFLLSRDGCSVADLPGQAELTARLGLLRDLLTARAPGDGPAAAAVARDAATTLFAPFAEQLRSARLIVVAPDGPFYLVPLDLLLACLDTAAGSGLPTNLPAVSRIPSAGILARMRTDAPAGLGQDPARGLVFSAERNAAGQDLAGARSEAARLLSRYRGMSAWRSQVGSDDADQALAFGGHDLLHFASHTELDNERPWRSGILVAAREAGPDRWLRADRIATLELDARLAVLAGCESAGGRVLTGEGLQGLTSAFLAAGVPTLVATLWPIDDAAAARLMDRFYDGLARGLTVQAALGSARASAAREGESPADWAGYVIVGDPDCRLALRPSSRLPRLAVTATGCLLCLGLAAAAARRRTIREERA